MTTRRTYEVRGVTPDEAVKAAKRCAKEDELRVRTLARVDPGPLPDMWNVTLVVDDQVSA